jgi:hypothetical protein
MTQDTQGARRVGLGTGTGFVLVLWPGSYKLYKLQMLNQIASASANANGSLQMAVHWQLATNNNQVH